MEDDDVSALSMGGASAIGRDIAFTKRLRMKISDVQRLGTITDDAAAENDVDADSRHNSITKKSAQHDQQSPSSRSSRKKSKQQSDDNVLLLSPERQYTGDELIEPFPKTYEEWKEKKKKEKKHHHKSSKKSHKKSRRKDKERDSKGGGGVNNEMDKPPPLPIKEIAIRSSSDSAAGSTGGGGSAIRGATKDITALTTSLSPAKSSFSRSNISLSRRSGSGLYSQSHNSISSTDSSTNYRSSSILSSGQGGGGSGIIVGGGKVSTTVFRPRHRHSSDFDLSESQRSYSSYASQSHITVEKINHIKLDLERAKLEEKQVLEIYSQLKMEVEELQNEARHVHDERRAIHQELEIASTTRQHLQHTLNQLQEENDKLRVKLRKAEDKEDKKRLDDVLDSMEAKMKALKLQSKRSNKGKSNNKSSSSKKDVNVSARRPSTIEE